MKPTLLGERNLITVHFGPCDEDGSSVGGVRGLQRPAPHIQENFRHWGHKGLKKGHKPGHCNSYGNEMQIKQKQSVEVLHSKPPGVPAETRWCIGAVH